MGWGPTWPEPTPESLVTTHCIEARNCAELRAFFSCLLPWQHGRATVHHGPNATRSKSPVQAKSRTALPVVGVNIDINDKDRAAIVKGLGHLLADTDTLYLNTHNFHWNVTGPMFNTLHQMFMLQYTELWNAADPIAERIRSLGHPAPGSYKQFAALASLPDAPTTPPKALEMVRILVQGHEAVARAASFPRWTKPVTSPPPICSLSASPCTNKRLGCCAVCWKSEPNHG